MPLHVLICDDSSISRKMVKKAVSIALKEEVEISQAQNGVEALEAYHNGKADIMFLDLTMPEMDGFSVLEKLKEEHAKTVVIVISADIQPEAQKRVFELGATAFIKKPITPEDLNKKIHEIGIL
ncbi:response regulator [Zooshikella marina]|uniref:response regulator n=1 Tax=Zooshikella ganghwensis TaxID=202772 RepID=UPI001BB0D2C1|nr:response regulator [Zooshikella ganghwensis]MBU2708657.1 response regulator [Zooshikella ganghwensis]